MIGPATVSFPDAPARVARELAMELAERGFSSFTDAVGYAHRGPDRGPAPGGSVSDFRPDAVAVADDELVAGVEG
mgnify:FL=1